MQFVFFFLSLSMNLSIKHLTCYARDNLPRNCLCLVSLLTSVNTFGVSTVKIIRYHGNIIIKLVYVLRKYSIVSTNINKQTNKKPTRDLSPRANHTDREPPIVGEVSANFYE
jgi:hypothetical protein